MMPLAMHSVELGQLAPIRVVFAVGTALSDQLAPWLAVVAMTPCPTATQCEVSLQATASRTGVPAGRVELTQLVPPSVLNEATPAPWSSAPTAKQSVVSEQVTPLKFP
jgi:hypothetical protein